MEIENTFKSEQSSPLNSIAMEKILSCPDCHGILFRKPDALECNHCKTNFPFEDQIPVLIGKHSILNANEVQTQDRVSDNYESVRYKKDFSQNYHAHICRQILDLADRAGLILDNGCGNGWFYEMVGQSDTDDLRIVGLDVSSGMLRKARTRLTEVVRGDSCRLPFKSNSFQTVIARGLLHHLPDPSQGIAEIQRVLRKGGTLVAYEPNRNFISNLPRKLANKTEHFDDDHKNFHARELKELIGTSLEIHSIKYTGYVAYPLLAFPDLINFSTFLPLKFLGNSLIKLDEWIGRIPGVQTLSWAVLVLAKKA